MAAPKGVYEKDGFHIIVHTDPKTGQITHEQVEEKINTNEKAVVRIRIPTK